MHISTLPLVGTTTITSDAFDFQGVASDGLVGALPGKRSVSSLISDDDDINGAEQDHSLEEQKKWKRIMSNRRSAKESRERRKKFLVDLSEAVEALTKENVNLSAQNSELRRQVEILLPQVEARTNLSSMNFSQLQQHHASCDGVNHHQNDGSHSMLPNHTENLDREILKYLGF
jgi:hypothetical protein